MRAWIVLVGVVLGCDDGGSGSDPPADAAPGTTGDAGSDAQVGDAKVLVSGLARRPAFEVVDGKLVFTLSFSEEKLYSCDATVGCGTTPEQLLTEPADVFSLTVTDGKLFYRVQDRIRTLDVGTKTAMDVVSGQEQPQGFLIDGPELYWVNPLRGALAFSDGSVMKCTLATCAGSVVTLATGQARAGSVGVDATHIYWTGAGNPGTTGYVRRCDRTGTCTPQNLLTSLTDAGPAMEVDTDHLYFVFTDEGNNRRPRVCPRATCTASTTTVLSNEPPSIQTYILEPVGGKVYWVANSKILRCPEGGCGASSPPELVYQDPDMSGEFHMDATSIFFVASGANNTYEIRSIPR